MHDGSCLSCRWLLKQTRQAGLPAHSNARCFKELLPSTPSFLEIYSIRALPRDSYTQSSKMGRHFSNLLYGAWLFQLFHFVAWAQKTIQNILWNVPDGDLPDLSQTFTAGSTLPLSWNNYTSTLYVDTTKNLVDLWVASFDNSLNSFSQLIKGRDGCTKKRLRS
jgi:hypothetical protein